MSRGPVRRVSRAGHWRRAERPVSPGAGTIEVAAHAPVSPATPG